MSRRPKQQQKRPFKGIEGNRKDKQRFPVNSIRSHEASSWVTVKRKMKYF
jgi:hypothetical protein